MMQKWYFVILRDPTMKNRWSGVRVTNEPGKAYYCYHPDLKYYYHTWDCIVTSLSRPYLIPQGL